MKKSLFLYFITAFFCLTLINHATAENAISANAAGEAIDGYDTVAFFTDKKAVKGSAQFTCEWQGRKWLFASEENKNKFLDNPEKYAPQYGGYCAHAVGKGKLLNASPAAWTVNDDKLYFNVNEKVQKKWQKNLEKNVRKSDKEWIDLEVRF